MRNQSPIKPFALGVLTASLLVAGVSCAATEPGSTQHKPLYVHCDNVE